jgi:hypothetical protein
MPFYKILAFLVKIFTAPFIFNKFLYKIVGYQKEFNGFTVPDGDLKEPFFRGNFIDSPL